MPRLIRFLALALGLLVLLPTFPVSAAEYPSVSGECACVYLPALDCLVYDKNANRRHPMASTTKIMTALVALENSRPEEEVIVAAEAAGIEGSSIYLQAGEVQTMENLLYALLLESANDAAAAIAIHVAGSIDGFAALMNTRAQTLGLRDTHFTNPHGLAAPQHYTTAYDLARITAAAMENEAFFRIVSTKNKMICAADGSKPRSLSNHNKLLRSYDDCVGVKTGFTKISGRCLVSAAERDGMLLIAVTLDAPDDWRDHTAMLDYGFSRYEGRVLNDCQGTVFSLPVIGGTLPAVSISARSTPVVVVEKDGKEIKAQLEMNRFAAAPIRRGDVLGVIRYTKSGETIATLPLLAEHAVAKAPVHETLWDKIKSIWNR